MSPVAWDKDKWWGWDKVKHAVLCFAAGLFLGTWWGVGLAFAIEVWGAASPITVEKHGRSILWPVLKHFSKAPPSWRDLVWSVGAAFLGGWLR